MQYRRVDNRHLWGNRGWEGVGPRPGRYLYLGYLVPETGLSPSFTTEFRANIAGTGTSISTLTKSSKHIFANVRTSVRSWTSLETGAVGSKHVLSTHFLSKPAKKRKSKPFPPAAILNTDIWLVLWRGDAGIICAVCCADKLWNISDFYRQSWDAADICKTWHDLVKKWMSFEYLHKFSRVKQKVEQIFTKKNA